MLICHARIPDRGQPGAHVSATLVLVSRGDGRKSQDGVGIAYLGSVQIFLCASNQVPLGHSVKN